ncbi:MAG: amidohydrolase family protein [Deltaproteobacteria bacterium]|jgi:predicted amidohydrolase|nr:amidohydrolase family protein [Deltaproteobacteria bacterium]
MQADIAIINGHIIDPVAGINGPANVYVKGKRVIPTPSADDPAPKYVVDAAGCLVFPGFIDMHAHVYAKGNESGVPHEFAFAPGGVTTILDGGTAGSANFEGFYDSVIATASLRIKSLLNIAPTGLCTRRHHENVNPACYDEPRMRDLFAEYPDVLVGIKARVSRNIVGELGLEPLKHTVDFADSVQKSVVVHVTDPAAPLEDIADILRPGDVICHVYQGRGHTILDAGGAVSADMRRARERGILFDAANGSAHFSLPLARKALEQDFLPDFISTDLSTLTMFREPVMGMAYLLSKYLNLGMDETALARCAAEAPGRWLGMEGQIGTLAPGAFADVAVLRKEKKRVKFTDSFKASFYGTVMLMPQLTMHNGRILFRQMDFAAP